MYVATAFNIHSPMTAS